jgi:sarcosine oxidase subunit beta
MAVDLPASAEVVIIGGGATGTAAAWALARRGLTDVLLLERETLASGSTGRATGGVRLQFADELNVRMMLRSVEVFERWGEEVGAGLDYVPDIGFRQNGYLVLLSEHADVDRFRAAIAMQRALGVPVELLDPGAAQAIAPPVSMAGVLAAAWCPRDGYLTPDAVVGGYAAAAAARGVHISQRAAVTGLDVVAGRIDGVRVGTERVATGVVISAAGAWSAGIGAMAGLDVPVHGERHVNWFSRECGPIGADLPMVIDFSTGFHIRREGPGVLFGSRAQELDALAEEAARIVPVLATLPIHGEVAGLYDSSPDANAIIGEVDGPSRFLLATGFSGHGLMQSPAIGEHLAELVCGVAPTFDFAPFALGRFAAGDLRPEAFKI